MDNDIDDPIPLDSDDIVGLRSIAEWFSGFPNDDYKADGLFIEDVISKVAPLVREVENLNMELTKQRKMQPDSLGDWVRFEDYAELEAKLAAAEADAEAVQRQREDLKDKYALVEISDIPLLLESAAQRIAIGDWVFAGKLMKAAELLQAELTTPESL